MPKYNYGNKPQTPMLQSAGDAQLATDLAQVEKKVGGWINSQYLNSNQFSALVKPLFFTPSFLFLEKVSMLTTN
jgi:hypothetical protein